MRWWLEFIKDTEVPSWAINRTWSTSDDLDLSVRSSSSQRRFLYADWEVSKHTASQSAMDRNSSALKKKEGLEKWQKRRCSRSGNRTPATCELLSFRNQWQAGILTTRPIEKMIEHLETAGLSDWAWLVAVKSVLMCFRANAGRKLPH